MSLYRKARNLADDCNGRGKMFPAIGMVAGQQVSERELQRRGLVGAGTDPLLLVGLMDGRNLKRTSLHLPREILSNLDAVVAGR